MVNCNNDYVCEEDVITTDEIDSDEQCVAVSDGMCTTCGSIGEIRKANAESFNQNPIYSIFGVNRPQDTDAFWNVLQSKCSINKPASASQEEPGFYVGEPEYSVLDSDYATILDRIREMKMSDGLADVNASNFITSLHKIGSVGHGHAITSVEHLRSKVHQVLHDTQCSSRMIHDPTKLPLNIQLFFSQLAASPPANFKRVILLLEQKNQACLEGIIDQSTRYLSSGGRRRQTSRKPRRKTRRRRGGFLSPKRWARQGHAYMRKKYSALTSYLPSWQRVKERTRSIFSKNHGRHNAHEDQERVQSLNRYREDMENARFGGR